MRFSITSIELTNFRQYRGTHNIELSVDKKKNVAIIHGKNGAGKSNLLNALTWCFYGIETHSTYEDNEKMPIINTNELTSLNANESVDAEVTIYLDTDKGPWFIKRVITGGKRSDGTSYIQPESELKVSRSVDGQDIISTGKDTEVLINNLLPKDLRSFFFMDGEKLREFFNKDTTENIGESIEKVSQLDLMYNAGEHLEIYEKELRRSVKESTPQLEKIEREIEKVDNKIDKLKSNLNKSKEELKANNSDLKNVRDYLKGCGIEQVEKLESERQEHEEDIRNIKERIFRKKTERNQYLVNITPYIYLKDSIDDSLDIIEDKQEKGELPPKIKETLVLELIEKGECICGTRIEGKVKDHLHSYCKTLTLSELGELSIVGKMKFKDIQSEFSQFSDKMNSFHNQLTEMGEELEKKERRLEQIKESLKKGDDKTTIINYERRREELTRLIAKKELELKGDKGELDTAQQILDELKREHEKELGASEKNAKLKLKLKLVQNTLRTLADAEVAIKNKLREQIQHSTEANFFKLIRKKGAFKNVRISEKYEVVVTHDSGYNVIDHLSAGEYMILGLSFMSALMTISGFKAPVIIDTPLGKIDDEHRDKITTELPIFLEGTQLLLFVTPTEYDQKVRSNLSKYIVQGNYYEILENDKQDESKVVRK